MRTKRTTSRLLSILLCLVMVLGLLPTAAFAAGTGSGTSESDPIVVDNYTDLKAAMEAGKSYVQLGESFKADGLTKADTIKVIRTVTLDLNGKTLTLSTTDRSKTAFIVSETDGDLTIKDSSSDETGKIVFKNYADRDFGCISVAARLTMESGTLECTTDTRYPLTNSWVIRNGSTGHVTINGGKISNTSGLFYPAQIYQSSCALYQEESFCQTIEINGGTFDGVVSLTGRNKYEDDSDRVVNVINGGTFNGMVCIQGSAENLESVAVRGGTFRNGFDLLINNYGDCPDIFPDDTTILYQGMKPLVYYGSDNDTLNKVLYTVLTHDLLEEGAVKVFSGGLSDMKLTASKNETSFNIAPSATATNITAGTSLRQISAKLPDSLAAVYDGKTIWCAYEFHIYDDGSDITTTDRSIGYSDGRIVINFGNVTAQEDHTYLITAKIQPKFGTGKDAVDAGDAITGQWVLNTVSATTQTAIPSAPIKMSAALTPGSSAPTAEPYSASNPYRVESTTWYSDVNCSEDKEVTSFEAGKTYYAKIVLKPDTGYKFAGTAQPSVWCDDPNASYSRKDPTVAEDGSSLSVVVSATAQAALAWDEYPTGDQTCTLSADSGYGSLTLTAKAAGGDAGKPISYRLYARKSSGDAVIKASASVSTDDAFNAVCSFGKDDTGTYTCWFEATRGDVTITGEEFTVTVNAPELTITNQSGDMTVKQGSSARLWVKAEGLGLDYQWQVKNSTGTWEDIATDGDKYVYYAPTSAVGEKTYRCKITDDYGGHKASAEMTVTVTAGEDETITPAMPIATVNGVSSVDPAERFPDKIIYSRDTFITLDVTEGYTFAGTATYSMIPRGYYLHTTTQADIDNGTARDAYDERGSDGTTVTRTPVIGDVTYEWKGTTEWYQMAPSSAYKNLGSGDDATITIPNCTDLKKYNDSGNEDESETYKYYVEMTVTNKVGTSQRYSTVHITFNVSPKHEHDYTDHYAQLNDTQHTKYCACGASTKEAHDNSGTDGACSKCGYTPAKTYSITVKGGTANPTEAKAGATITLTVDNNKIPTGYAFDQWAGNVKVNTGSDGSYTFTMPSHDVELSAIYKATEVNHTWGAWEFFNEYFHRRTCSDFGCTAVEFAPHTYPDTWTDDPTAGKHTHTCTADNCNATESQDHKWVYDKQFTAPTLTAEGSAQYKCSATGCTATKTEPIAKLEAITDVNVTVTAPVRGNTPEDASADSTAAYYVASTDWTPTVSSTFAGGAKYTVKVSLEALGSYRFTNSTAFKINGQTATIVGTTPGADGKGDVILSYEFPATSSGSSSGGSGGGSSSAYTVTVKDAQHGTVTADRKTATSGTIVTLTVKPEQGWTLETLTATNASGKEVELTIVKVGEKYTFKMPASNVTVNATFMEDNTILNYFVDVPTNSYYYDAVLWAVDKGITQGTDNSHFNPSGICTRAQAVTFLWRAADSPAPKTTTMPFTDVPAGSYYYDAVLWAVENGITRGTSDTTFSPNQTCTRAQIVTFLWRSEQSPAAGTVNPFTDVKSDAYYADAVLWAVKEDVTKGTTDTTFSPDANCTRAQIVTFIWRCMQ